MFQKLKTYLIATILCSTVLAGLAPAVTYADKWASSSSSSTSTSAVNGGDDPCHPEKQTDSKGNLLGNPPLTSDQVYSCEHCKDPTPAGIQACLSRNPIVKRLNEFVNFLAGAVGVVTVAMIVVGGIQYSLARNKPEAVAAARKRVANAVIALVAFMLIYAFLQWLIPGGPFG